MPPSESVAGGTSALLMEASGLAQSVMTGVVRAQAMVVPGAARVDPASPGKWRGRDRRMDWFAQFMAAWAVSLPRTIAWLNM